MAEIIYGKNPVMEALKADSEINKIMIADSVQRNAQNIIKLAREKKIPYQIVAKDQMDHKFQGNHQGVAAFLAKTVYYELEDILQSARNLNEHPFILLLDEIEDPHNLGAIIRTAYAAGVHGVVIPKRRAAAVNETVAKTSAGAVADMKIARVANVNQAIKTLQENGCWVVGTDAEAENMMWETDLQGPIALVIGNEESGIKSLTKKNCDILVSIPMRGKVASLNASVAAAVLCYEVMRQRG